MLEGITSIHGGNSHIWMKRKRKRQNGESNLVLHILKVYFSISTQPSVYLFIFTGVCAEERGVGGWICEWLCL